MFGNRSILREPARPEIIRESPRAPWLAVGVVCFGAFMGQLDASIVTITFPAMEHDFAVPVAGVQWVSLSYLLGLVALLAPAGRILVEAEPGNVDEQLTAWLERPAGRRGPEFPWARMGTAALLQAAADADLRGIGQWRHADRAFVCATRAAPIA